MLSSLTHASLFIDTPEGPRGHLVETDIGDPSTGSYVLTLRNSARFSDGTRIRSQDVVASLTRLARSPRGWLLSGIQGYDALADGRAEGLAGVRALDDRRIILTTQGGFTGLPSILASPAAAIVNAAEPADALWGPPGAGAFRPSSNAPSGSWVLLPSLRSVGGRPFLDQLTVRREPDERNALGALRQGRSQAAVVQQGPGETEPATVILLINPRLPKALRERVSNSVDRNVLAEVFLRGRALPAGRILPPALGGPAPPEPKTRQNGTSHRLKLYLPDNPADLTTVAERLAVDFLASGIVLERAPGQPTDLETRAAAGDYDLMLVEWRPAALDPSLALWEWGARPALRALLGSELTSQALQLPKTANPDQRLRAALRLEQALMQQHLVLPLYHPTLDLRTVPRLQGLQQTPRGLPDWANAWLAPGAAK
jgi:MarR-like DNA-binding transcriptional regulator SgrR of sgrS sRNA